MRTKLFDITTPQAMSEILLGPIDQTGEDLELIVEGRSTHPTGTYTRIRGQLNGAQDAVYQWQSTIASGRSGIEPNALLAASGGGDEPSAVLGYLPTGPTTDPSNRFRGHTRVLILSYRAATWQKQFQAFSGAAWSVQPGEFMAAPLFGFWRQEDQGAVQWMRLYLDHGSFLTGTRVRLYRWD